MKDNLARKVYERSQHITVRKMKAARPGAYRMANGVALEDGGEEIDHRVIEEEPK